MKKLMCAALVAGIVAGIAAKARAEDTGFLLGAWDPAQTASAEVDLKGFGFGLLWDRCHDAYGINLAGGGTVQDGELKGAQVALGFNWNEKGGFGAMGALGFNRAGYDFGGYQFAIGANICHGHFYGFQESLSNYAENLHGVQYGIVNMSHDAHGLQVGIINTAERLSGIQVGILNFIKESPLPFFPIVNAYF